MLTIALTAAAGLTLGLGTTAAHAVVIEAVGTPNTTDVPSPGDLGTAQVGTVDSAFGDTGTPAGGTNAQVGFSQAGAGGSERRAVAEFDISDAETPGITADIAAATQILLTFSGAAITSTGGADFTIVGNAVSAGEDGDITVSDFSTAGVQLTETFQFSSVSNGDSLTFDVTAFVKADSLAAQQFSGFRLQSSASRADKWLQ